MTEAADVDTSACDMDKAGTYTVKVSYTENGITVSDTFQIKVELKDEPAGPTDPDQEAPDPSDRPGNPENPGTSAPSADAGSTAVQTGDMANPAVWILLLTASALVFAGAVVFRKKKGN